MAVVAPGACGGVLRCGLRRGGREVEPPEVEVEFDQRLAREVDRGPAVERAVAARARDAVDHDDRAVDPHLGLARQRRPQQAGRVEREFHGNVLARHWRVGHRGLDVERKRMAAGMRVALEAEAAVRADGRAGADPLDAAFHAVMCVEKPHHAVVDGDAFDRRRVRSIVRGCVWRGGGCLRRGPPLTVQRDADLRMIDHKLGDVRMARPQARKREVGLNAAGGKAAAGVAVVRPFQCHVAHRDVERRPQPETLVDPATIRW